MPKVATTTTAGRRREQRSNSKNCTGPQDDHQPTESTQPTMALIRDETIQKVALVCQREITELFKIWEETGIQNDVLSTYADQVNNHIVGLLKDMVGESEEKKRQLLKNIKIMAQTARKLSKELGKSFETDGYNSLPLVEMEEKLKNEVANLQQQKDKRSKYAQELITKESKLCMKMGTKPFGFNCDLPSEEEIKVIENRLHLLESEINRLSEVFKAMRESIINIMEELEIVPAHDFETVVCDNYTNFIYSSSNMSKLKDLHEKLTKKFEDTKLQVQEKFETITALWDYLDEPEENRQAFMMKHAGYSLVTLNALNAEIKRCREKRSENVANFVSKIRKEIENLWELCKYGELQKKTFTVMKCHTYTDDLLMLHEMEADKLRKYYNANKQIFNCLNEWEVQFEKLKELDQRANDPDRYHNRGGQLLLEEKERKSAEKKLPKLENQLYIFADEYEQTIKNTFLVYGYSMREFMRHARESYDLEKENMKLARKQAKDRSVKKTPLSTSKRTPGASMLRGTPGASMLRGTPGTSMLRVTPASVRYHTPVVNRSRFTPLAKRKLPYDGTTDVTEHKKRAISPGKSKVTVISTKLRRSGRIAGGINFNGSGRVKKSVTKKKKSKNESLLSLSAYGSFQDHLVDRPELRSSVLPVEIKVPEMKTPMKPARRKLLTVSTPLAPNSIPKLRSTPKNPQLLSSAKLTSFQNLSSIEI